MDASELLYPGERERALPYYVAIGRLCVVWGPIENVVSQLAAMAYINYPDHRPQLKNNGGDADPPDAFSQKMNLIEKALRAILPQGEFETSVAPLLDDLRHASRERNILLHTNWSGIWNSSSDDAPGHRIKRSGRHYQSISGTTTLDALLDLTEHLAGLSARLLSLAARGTLNPRSKGAT